MRLAGYVLDSANCSGNRSGGTPSSCYRKRRQGPGRSLRAGDGENIGVKIGCRIALAGSNCLPHSVVTVPNRQHFSGDSASMIRPRQGAMGVARNYSPPNPALKHARTDSQSESESRPISRTSRCGRVTGNNLRYDAVCNPACFQSSNAQSVGATGFGACVVIRPTTTSGRVDGSSPSRAPLRDASLSTVRQVTRPRQHRRASTIFPLLILEAPHCGRCRFGEILVCPRVGPLDNAPARKISQLPRPIEHLPSFIRRECPDHTD